MPPVDAPPGVALTAVPINIRPRAAATSCWIKSALCILRAACVRPGCAGWYWLCLCGTQGEPHSGDRDGARQQCHGNDPVGGVHRVFLRVIAARIGRLSPIGAAPPPMRDTFSAYR